MELSPFPEPEWAKSANWFSGAIADEADTTEIRKFLRDRSIDARPFWKPIHLQPPYADAPTTLNGTSDQIWQRGLTLPCSSHISEEDLEVVISAVLDFYL
jgi:dTDP-4-amino-4,6-dideoxygalactose transaminase